MYNIEIIVAHCDDLVIGYKDDLPWPHNKEDMKHFKKLTLGQKVVMGRKTYESIVAKNGGPLKDRTNIIMSRDLPSDVFPRILESSKKEKFMVIGGAQIYKLFLPHANKLHVTRVLGSYPGDTYFPEYRDGDWQCVEESGKPGLRFLTYVRSETNKLI